MGEDGCFEGSGSVSEIETDSDHSFHRHSIHSILHHSPTVKPCQTSLPAPRTLASSVRPVALQAHLGHPLAERPGASPREGILASHSIGIGVPEESFWKGSHAKRCKTMQNDAKRCKTMQTDAKRCKTMQNDAKRCKTMQNLFNSSSTPFNFQEQNHFNPRVISQGSS